MSLEETIRNIQNLINENSSHYSKSESDTCLHLILPLIEELGWHRTSIFSELNTNDGFPDYTLKKNGSPKLLIEAKSLNKPLHNPDYIRQLGRYLQSEGISYGLLTDGARYVLYRTFREGSPFEHNKIWNLDIQSDNFPRIVNLLNSISFDNIENLEQRWVRRQKMEEIWKEMFDKKDDIIMSLKVVFKENLILQLGNDLDDLEINELIKEKVEELIDGNSPPSSYPLSDFPIQHSPSFRSSSRGTAKQVFIGRDVFNVGNNKDILIAVVEWLIRTGKLSKNNQIPVNLQKFLTYDIRSWTQGKRNLSRKLSNGLYLYYNYSAVDTDKHAYEIMRYFGCEGELKIIRS